MATVTSFIEHIEPYRAFARHIEEIHAAVLPLRVPDPFDVRSTLADAEAVYGRGTVYGDIVRVRLGDEDALERLAATIEWKLHNRQLRAALKDRASHEDVGAEALKHRLLMAAVLLALSRYSEEQYHRFGREWYVGEDGRKEKFAPWDILPVADDILWQWLHSEAIKAAEADLLALSYPPAEPDVLVKAVEDKRAAAEHDKPRVVVVPLDPRIVPDAAPDPLYSLLAAEQHRPLLDLLAPQDRELFSLVADGSTLAEAAKAVGISEGNAYVRRNRLQKKLGPFRKAV